MTPNEISFPLAPKAPAPPESGLAEAVNEFPRPVPATPPVDIESGSEPVLEETVISEPPVEVSTPSKHRRARRFHADTPFVLGLLLFLVAAMAAASFYVSFSGLFAAAAWAVGDNPPLQFAVPFMLDVAIVAFTLALFVERERGERVWGTWIAIAAFAGVSATANILHTLVVSTATDSAQLLVGAIISGGAPVLLAFATDKIAVKVFRKA